jgi:hypothetical protein
MMNYAWLYGYETALEKIGFHNAEILNALKFAAAGDSFNPHSGVPEEELAAARDVPKGKTTPASMASKLKGKWGKLPGAGKGALIGGAGLAAGAGLSHLLSKKDKD